MVPGCRRGVVAHGPMMADQQIAESEEKNMAIDFKEAAKQKAEERGGCALFEGREVLKNDMVIALYPNGVTIIAAEIFSGVDDKGEAYDMAAYQIAEDATKACKGGKVLVNIFREWLAQYDGDVDAMNKDLAAFGGVKVKLSKVITNRGKVVTNVEVL